MSSADIRMSDVFSLPLDATYDNLQDANGYEVACFEITIQDEAAANAINSHDALVEQNKALMDALSKIAGIGSSYTSLVMEYPIAKKIADKALEQNK